MVALVERFDYTRLDASRVKQTSQGFLTVAGRLTRVGVLDYYRADGSVYRELRHPEDVFDARSLSSLVQAPMTKLHGGMVNPDNVQALQVGVVGADVQGRTDGPYVTGSATVQRADTIKAVIAKDLNELSPGYRCAVEDGPGTWDGSEFGLGVQKYDGRQRSIDYNHLAIGPRDWGRSGRNVALRMDSLDPLGAFARCDSHGLGALVRERLRVIGKTEAELAANLQMTPFEIGTRLDGFVLPSDENLEKISGHIDVPVERLKALLPPTTPPAQKLDSPDAVPDIKDPTPMKKITVVMDGVSYVVEIAEALAPTFESSLAKLHTDAKGASEAQGKLLAVEKERDELKVNLDAATNPEALAVHIAERTKLVQDAKRIAPADHKIDERADDRTVKVSALVASGFEAAAFEKCDSNFVDGVWAGALRSAPKSPSLRTVPGPPPVLRNDDGTTPAPTDDELKTPVTADKCTEAHADAARDRMVAESRDTWQKPFGATSKAS
jgi:hypothetical protein